MAGFSKFLDHENSLPERLPCNGKIEGSSLKSDMLGRNRIDTTITEETNFWNNLVKPNEQ